MDSKTKLLIIILCLVLFAIGFGAGYLTHYAIVKNAAPADDRAAYKALEGCYDVAAYEDFLAEYPESPRAASVRDRKEQLETMLAEWAQIQAIGNIGDFLNFKANYSNPRYNHLCDMKIDSLDYVNARTANTVQAYKAYIRKYPEGRYVAAANEAMKTATIDMSSPQRRPAATRAAAPAAAPTDSTAAL